MRHHYKSSWGSHYDIYDSHDMWIASTATEALAQLLIQTLHATEAKTVSLSRDHARERHALITDDLGAHNAQDWM